MASGSGYSRQAVYRNQTKSGFRQQVLIMFHGTPLTNVESILDNGFRASRDGMLGPGIYASSDFGKAAAFGPCVFKILVYVGRVCKVDAQGHPLQKAWQTKHDSAWVPQGCGMTARQENCIKSGHQIRILGICQGYNQLPPRVQAKVKDLSNGNRTTLQGAEWTELNNFVRSLGI